jgi:cytidylate kinase
MALSIGHGDLKQMVASLRTSGNIAVQGSQAELAQWPFVTISRQAGSGGRDLGIQLAKRLNEKHPTGHPWQFLDRELVERIAADHHLSADLVQSLERSSHTWIGEFFGGMSLKDHAPSELTVLKRVVETVRALARAGHVILVELGGAFITHGMAKGLHVRLVAPLEWRIERMARTENLTKERARERVRQLDRSRESFRQKYWPQYSLDQPEVFHLVMNASMLTESEMVEAILPLIRR